MDEVEKERRLRVRLVLHNERHCSCYSNDREYCEGYLYLAKIKTKEEIFEEWD